MTGIGRVPRSAGSDQFARLPPAPRQRPVRCAPTTRN